MFGWTPGQVVDALTALASCLASLLALFKLWQQQKTIQAIHQNTKPQEPAK